MRWLDLRGNYDEKDLGHDEEIEQPRQDYIDKVRHTMQVVRTCRLMFGEP